MQSVFQATPNGTPNIKTGPGMDTLYLRSRKSICVHWFILLSSAPMVNSFHDYVMTWVCVCVCFHNPLVSGSPGKRGGCWGAARGGEFSFCGIVSVFVTPTINDECRNAYFEEGRNEQRMREVQIHELGLSSAQTYRYGRYYWIQQGSFVLAVY